ncbi:hypothetical protein [Truepera radiovictrix]|uniref:Uncharacterized protein n=1 Tax=Truepera radiovictrix (strain DSM 17093 / CIP 108686 / LMG 22925 / RQ-24) TaxID=649638 RepID=D7CRK2_TRURR|nr:hypothetical protein [Truepera radiovictrix]ADI13492.1 hypothetical protein Trad_0353 [Truepera radiovictrix DSM 17093]WMT57946.1 hypothetical protein RCV51_03105 [Truepera radiovictrix]
MTSTQLSYDDPERQHHHQEARRALQHMQALLPVYRDLCGEAPYLYAASEVERLERELGDAAPTAPDDLVWVAQHITLQLQGLALAIRKAKGRGVELDA